MSETNPTTNILIVTVTTVGSEAVRQVFREATGKDPRPESIGDRMYHDLADVGGVHVFLALSEMGAGGLGASQQAVQKGIDALHPSAVIMVGIAFGVNEQKQAIGDILVSRQLWLYDLQRIGKNEIIPRGDKPHASTWLIDRLRGAEFYWKGAKVHFGLVLTGEKLVDNLDYRDQLKHFEVEAIGGEMEGAGLYVACQDRQVDWILVKAICDWADGNKRGPNKDSHQVTAAHNAASFVLHALQLSPLKRKAEAQIDRGKDEQNDVQILVQTDKLLTSLRALDNAIHLHVGELTSRDLDSLTRGRNELIKQISDLAQREELIDDVRESLRTLEVLKVNANKGDQALVTKIFECGADILRVLSNSPVTPFPDTEALRDETSRLVDITADSIELFLRDRLRQRVRVKANLGYKELGAVKVATVHQEFRVLRCMLNVAVRKRLLRTNPCSGVEFPVAVKGLFRPHYVTWSEQQKIESHAPRYLRNVIRIITETGLRIYKELLPMKRDQVDLQNAVVWIPDSKTPSGIAEVPLTQLAIEALKDHMAISGEGMYLFPSDLNPTGHLKKLKTVWRKTLRRAKVSYFRIYDLRSTYATRLSAGGVADEWVTQMLRQSDAQVMKKYSQMKLRMKREALEKLNRQANEMKRTDADALTSAPLCTEAIQ